MDEYDSDEDSDYEIELDFDKINETLMKNLEEEDKEAYDNFVLVKKEIEDTTPDIKSILKSPIRIKDKARLFELFEVYKITPPLTEEHLMLKYKINKLIKVYTNDYKDEEKYTKKELEILKEKSKKIKQVSSKLALKHKILNFKLKT